jgi:hypothetical protein
MTDSTVPPNSASRKHPTTNLARGIDELDAVGSLAIAKRSSRAPNPNQAERKTSPSTATLAAAKSGESSAKSASKSVSEVNDSLGQSSQAWRPSRVTARPRPSARPPVELSIWPQWLFATAVLGAALWYLFSAEAPGKNQAVPREHKAAVPNKQ